MDGDLLADVCRALRASLSGETAARTAAFLGGLAQTPRLSLAVMMIDSREDVEGLFNDMALSGYAVDDAVRAAFA